MDEDHGAEFVRDPEKAVQARVAELGVSDPSSDLDTEKPALAHAAAQFVNGSVGVL